MNNKKIKVTLLSLSVAAFLMAGCVDSKKIKQLENEVNQLNQVVLQKDIKINSLVAQTDKKQKELDVIKKGLDSAKKELDATKKELDSVNKKLDSLTAKPGAAQKK